MQVPLIIRVFLSQVCGIRLQFGDSIYSCVFHESSNLLNTNIFICLWIQQTFPNSANFDASFTSFFHDNYDLSDQIVACFGRLSCFRTKLSNTLLNLFVRGIQNSLEDLRKTAKLLISRQFNW